MDFLNVDLSNLLTPLVNDEHVGVTCSDEDDSSDSETFDEKLAMGFRPLDSTEIEKVLNGGDRNSNDVDKWARKRFDSWRIFNKLSTRESVEEMFKRNVAKLVDLLHNFFLQVQKTNGPLYSPET